MSLHAALLCEGSSALFFSFPGNSGEYPGGKKTGDRGAGPETDSPGPAAG
jgi:hypothetical protein